jgi:hypothetical protein
MQTRRTLRITILGLCLAAPALAQSDGGSDMHMDMNHMRMTAHQPAAPGDSARAAQVLATLRTSLAPYGVPTGADGMTGMRLQ